MVDPTSDTKSSAACHEKQGTDEVLTARETVFLPCAISSHTQSMSRIPGLRGVSGLVPNSYGRHRRQWVKLVNPWKLMRSNNMSTNCSSLRGQ